MALKGDRVILETDIHLAGMSVTNRGVVLVISLSGSGAALGDTAGQASLATSASGNTPAGLLLNDIVQIDETRFHRNYFKLQQLVGERCTLLTKGRVTTDQVSGSPTAGQTAYLTSNGQLTPTLSATGGLVATPKVGKFASAPDESGFVTVDINLPVA
jgi:hypothetical protein